MPTNILLKAVPADIYKKIVMEQASSKIKKDRKVSMTEIIFKMIRSYEPEKSV